MSQLNIYDRSGSGAYEPYSLMTRFTFDTLTSWYDHAFRTAGPMLIALQDGRVEDVSHFISKLERLHAELGKAASSYGDPDKRRDLKVMRHNVADLVAHLNSDIDAIERTEEVEGPDAEAVAAEAVAAEAVAEALSRGTGYLGGNVYALSNKKSKRSYPYTPTISGYRHAGPNLAEEGCAIVTPRESYRAASYPASVHYPTSWRAYGGPSAKAKSLEIYPIAGGIAAPYPTLGEAPMLYRTSVPSEEAGPLQDIGSGLEKLWDNVKDVFTGSPKDNVYVPY